MKELGRWRSNLISFFTISLLILSNSFEQGSANGEINTESLELPFNKKHVEVELNVLIHEAGPINCFTERIEVCFTLSQSWRDVDSRDYLIKLRSENMSIDSGSETLIIENFESVNLNTTFLPRTRVGNGHKISSNYNLGDTSDKLLRLDVATAIYTQLETICSSLKCEEMDFSLYPFDRQLCEIKLESSLWKKNELTFRFLNESNSQMETSTHSAPPFMILRTKGVVEEKIIFGDIFSVGRVKIYFRRLWTSYFSLYFASMSSFVLSSLLTLWLVYPKISVTLNFINLALVNIFLLLFRSQLDIPKVYYVTALDAYFSVCITFIILVLLVNVYVLYYIKSEEEDDPEKAERRRAYDLNIRQSVKRIPQNNLSSFSQVPYDVDETSANENAPYAPWAVIKFHILDRIRRNSHWALLISFSLFNLVYWITMLSLHYA